VLYLDQFPQLLEGACLSSTKHRAALMIPNIFFCNLLDIWNELPASAVTSHTAALFKQRLHSFNFCAICDILVFILFIVLYLFKCCLPYCYSVHVKTAEGSVSKLFGLASKNK
jgi:hypothetical protein